MSLSKIISPRRPTQAAETNRWLLTITGLLLCLVGFAAAAFGGVEPWSELALLAASGVLAAAALTDAYRHGLGHHTAIAVGLLAAYAGLAVFQVIPLPAEVLVWLSPTRFGVVSDLLSSMPPQATISYYPVDTVASLRLVFIAAAVFVAAAIASRSVLAIQTVLLGLFFVGVAEACLAIAQEATGAEGIYWSTVIPGSSWTGSFVNHSNFAQLLNLTVGATLGLLLMRLSEDRRKNPYGSRTVSWEGFLQRYGGLLTGLTLQVVAIAVSLSRAGLVGMVLAAVVTCWVLRRTSRLGQSTWTLVVVPPLAFVALLLLGFDAVFLRIESLQESTSYADRINLGLCTIRVGWDHAVFGSGLGTHAMVFPAYDTTESLAVAEQADNDYAQAFEETGLIGLLLLAGLVVTAIAAIRRVLALRGHPGKYAAYGLVYGLVAIGVQSLTDFGQRVPAVFCATAALAGLVIGLVPRAENLEPSHRESRNAWRIGVLACAILLGGGWLSLLQSGVADYRANQWRGLAEGLSGLLEDADPEAAAPQLYLDRIAALEMAASIQPRRVETVFWLNAYRWEAFQFAAPLSGATNASTTNETALRIAVELTKGRRLCPTYGPAYTLEGQLRLVTGDPAGGPLLREGLRLTPNDPVACYAAAIHTLNQPTNETADQETYTLLQRAVALDGSFYADAAQAVIEARGNVEEATRLAGKDPSRIRALADLVQGIDALAHHAEPLRDRAMTVQQERVEQPNANPGEMADLAARLARVGRLDEAVAFYERALSLRFANSGWRLRLIDLLIELGRNEEALRETRTSIRMQPNSPPVQARLKKLLDLKAAEKRAPDGI